MIINYGTARPERAHQFFRAFYRFQTGLTAEGRSFIISQLAESSLTGLQAAKCEIIAYLLTPYVLLRYFVHQDALHLPSHLLSRSNVLSIMPIQSI